MTKTKAGQRKWLENIIAKCGGPAKPEGTFVLDDDMVVVVGTLAAFDLHAVVMADSGITVDKYLDELAKACSES